MFARLSLWVYEIEFVFARLSLVVCELSLCLRD